MIRPVNGNDVAILQQVSIETFRNTYEAFNTEEDMQKYISERYSKDVLLRELLSADCFYFIAEQDGSPAGYIKLRTTDEPDEMKGRKHIELERIYARKQFQGLGLGKLLIDKALSFARESGYEVLWLGVWKQNEKAFQFYKRNGFEIFGEHIFLLGSDPQSDWLMKKELA